MALGINTNVASLSAQNQLQKSQDLSNQALERLSSGLRINSAKDDAAGLAISTRFQAQISGLNVAQRNANDGISLAQTTEGALEEITNNLQRIRELAVQSANATNSASDRQALNDEVQARIDEIDRISSQTAFNGLKVLDGTFGVQNFQVGANAGETIGINLTQGTKASQIGNVASGTGTAVTAAIGDGGIEIALGDAEAVSVGPSVNGTEAGQTSDSAFAIAEAIKSSGVGGITASAETTITGGFTTIDASDAGDTYELTINGETIVSSTFDIANNDITGADMEGLINAKSDETGVTASFDAGSNEMTLTAADGRNIVINETVNEDATTGDTLAAEGFADGVFGANGADQTTRGALTLSASEEITISGTDVGNLGFTANASGDVVIQKDSSTLADVSVSDVDKANDAILRVDSALTSVNSLRGELGAIQNRFESTIANLATSSENLSAANSRILDADFAAETAKLSKSQVLQQAGISVLAQANARPQQVLSLLQ